ncbi:MAG: AI-2E family transporter [Campylobacterales bacterium]|nr:AI-2E family transporter [Campylobacterales bacterium]
MNKNIFLFMIFATVLYFSYELYRPFLQHILIASLLAIATSNIQKLFLHNNKILVSSVMTLSLAILFFVPITYTIFVGFNYINTLDTASISNMIDFIKAVILAILNFFGINENITQELKLKDTFTNVVTTVASFGKYSLKFIADIFMILIFYFFILLYGKAIVTYLKNATPLNESESSSMFREISSVLAVVFYSILINAVFQGVLFGVVSSAFGLDGVLLGVLYGFCSLIPIIGGLLMWLPTSIYLLYLGNFFGAIFLIIYSIVFISILADTFIKPLIIKYINKKLLKSAASVNELLIFFSIVAGLSVYGFWGMIIGPAITALLISILNLYANKKLEI